MNARNALTKVVSEEINENTAWLTSPCRTINEGTMTIIMMKVAKEGWGTRYSLSWCRNGINGIATATANGTAESQKGKWWGPGKG